MLMKSLALISFIFTTSVFAYSTLECSSNQDISYSSHSRVGGVRPFPGMITNIEEVKKNDEVIYRRVRREECDQISLCQMEQPDLMDINAETPFRFIERSKYVLSSEGRDMDPFKKETYVIKFAMDKEIWMLCDSFRAYYP